MPIFPTLYQGKQVRQARTCSNALRGICNRNSRESRPSLLSNDCARLSFLHEGFYYQVGHVAFPKGDSGVLKMLGTPPASNLFVGLLGINNPRPL